MVKSYNNFFLVNEDIHEAFMQAIQQDQHVYTILEQKAKANIFYIDFLKDCWLLFYLPDIPLKDPERSFYLQIRNTLYDLLLKDQRLIYYRGKSTGDEKLSLQYATLFAEVTSLVFKEKFQDEHFAYHCGVISSFYYTPNHYETGIFKKGEDTPAYINSQLYVCNQIQKDHISNKCLIAQLFHQHCYNKLSQLDILALNNNSFLTLIEKNWTKQH